MSLSASESLLRRNLSDPEANPLTAELDDNLEELSIVRMWERIDHSPQPALLKASPWASLAPHAGLPAKLGSWLHTSFSVLFGVFASTRSMLEPEDASRAFSIGRNRLAAAFALCTVLAIGIVSTLRLSSSGEALVLEGTSDQGAWEAALDGGELTRSLSFNDGSSIDLQSQAELSVLKNDGEHFETKLSHGKAFFRVEPGGPRRWRIDAGRVTVEVVGTQFSVDHSQSSTAVVVTRGVVIVRGDVPGGEVRLTRGQSIRSGDEAVLEGAAVLRDEQEANTKGAADSAANKEGWIQPPIHRPSININDLEELPSLADSPSQSNEAHPQEAPPPQGKLPATKAELSIQGSTPPKSPADADSPKQTRSIEELLVDADAARRKGDRALATQLFGQVVLQAKPGDVRRGIAALSFARVSRNPAAIAGVLKKGLSDMPPSLREPALARLVRAQQLMGNMEGARATARSYLAEFPAGPRTSSVKNWAALQ